jgi:sugar phosphate permease
VSRYRTRTERENVEPVVASSRVTRLHYAWIVVAVTALTLLVGAGVRAAPGVLIKPLEAEFGWSRAEISLAVAISILAFGLAAPLAGSLIDRFGPRLVMLGGAALTAAGLVPLLAMRELWQMHLFWGLVTGAGTGAVSGALGATVAMRWFKKHRGVIIGLFGAATSAGQLVFLPLLVTLTVTGGWRSAIGLLAVACAALLLPIALLMRNRPADVGLRPFGDDGDEPTASERAEEARRTPLRAALRTRDFWLLAGSFFICGYTTNGLIGTHLIPHAVEHGFTEVTAANAVALMGAMNVVGTLLSGWLTDRFDNRKLLATYYTFRALSIAALPLVLEVPQLFLFAVVYGLDWIATVPPTANLTATIYGRASLGALYGWIFFSHMVGAALAAYAGGFFRDTLGDYHLAFVSAAVLGFLAAGLSLRIRTSGLRAPVAAAEPA